MKVDGACHCGKIAYEAEIDPEKIVVCHCSDCQVLSGSAFRTVAVTVADGFTLLRGQPKIYVKTGESGNRREQAFCADCGSPFYATSVGGGPKVYNIRAGTLRQRDQLAPKAQIWHRSALPWLPELESLRKVEKQPT